VSAPRGFVAGADTQLGKHGGNVMADGLLADHEPRGDLGVRQTLRNQLQDLAFSPRQAGGMRRRRTAGAAGDAARTALP
jgi:hypothetical protein